VAFLFRDRVARRVVRWLAPSIAAACCGALAAGVLELTGDGDRGGALGVVATLGFSAVLCAPALVIATVVGRALWAAWQPRALAVRLIEEGGGAPVLAAWSLVMWLAALVVAIALFGGVWLLASDTAWQAMTVSFVVPVMAVGVLLVLVALAWPAARGIAWTARRVDVAWRRGGRRSLFTPWRIAAAFALTTGALVVVAWCAVVSDMIGAFDLSLLATPALAMAVALAVLAARTRIPGRVEMWIRRAIEGVVVAAVATALVTAQLAPSLTLSIWGDRPFAGLAIDTLYDVDHLRAGVSLAELAPTVAKPGAPHPDIILITIDTVRADHTPPYGGQADMPGLEHLGQAGVVFDWAFSPSNVTRRSIPSIVIGLQANRVHGRVVGWALRVDPRHVLLAERLREAGYETAGFMCCDGFWGPKFHTGLERGLSHLEIEKNGPELAKLARTWLDAREQRPDRKPLFVWMHLLEPHNWTEIGGEGRTDADRTRLYDRSLAVSDTALVELLGAFSKRAPELAPIVIVTADHGEALGEHGHAYHSTDLYDSQTHVPLVIAGPGIRQAHIPETVSLVDLVPTVMDLAGFDPPGRDAVDGRSLADLATGRRAPDPDGGEAFMAEIKDRSNAGGITAVVRGRWKLIADGGALELFDTRADPGEHSNQMMTLAGRPHLLELRDLLERREGLGHVSPFP
jgi:hypothetical protein